MLGFFFSKLMPDICRSMTRSGINNVANPSNGILQGFKSRCTYCESHGNNSPQPQPFRVGGQNCKI